MPTVECDQADCKKHGREICVAKRVTWKNGQCSDYEPRRSRTLDPPFNPRCHKQGGKFKSSRVTGVLK